MKILRWPQNNISLVIRQVKIAYVLQATMKPLHTKQISSKIQLNDCLKISVQTDKDVIIKVREEHEHSQEIYLAYHVSLFDSD